MARRYKQGFYKPTNPKKVIGDPTKIVYRSAWEKKVMTKFDHSSYILKWGSECFHIPYRSPIDQRIHRYFPDFIIITPNKIEGGKHVVTVFEVKPYNQTKVPRKGRKSEKTYTNEVMTYMVNQAKWEAAEAYCKSRGWSFQKLTEKEILPNV